MREGEIFMSRFLGHRMLFLGFAAFVAASCGKPPAPSAPAAEVATEAAYAEVEGMATQVEGGAKIRVAGSAEWRDLKVRDRIKAGDAVKTEDGGSADLLLVKEGAVRLKTGTEIEVEQNRAAAGTQEIVVKMNRGRVLHRFAEERDFKLDYTLKTDVAAAAIRGTEFDAQVGNAGTDAADFRVRKGTVVVMNDQGRSEVGGKSGVSVAKGAAPTNVRTLNEGELKELEECGLVRFSAALKKARRVATVEEFRVIANALDVYRATHGGDFYPGSLKDADAHQYLDAWGKPYRYEVSADKKGFTILCNGPDGAPDTDDDFEYTR